MQFLLARFLKREKIQKCQNIENSREHNIIICIVFELGHVIVEKRVFIDFKNPRTNLIVLEHGLEKEDRNSDRDIVIRAKRDKERRDTKQI